MALGVLVFHLVKKSLLP